MIFVEFGDRGLEGKIAACDLKLLHKVGGRVNRTRQPLSINAKPSAAARWDFQAPGGPKHNRLAPFSSQASQAASACTCAFEIIGTAVKSNVSRVFPGGNRASSRCRSKRRRFRSTISCSARAARKRAAGQPSLSAVVARAARSA